MPSPHYVFSTGKRHSKYEITQLTDMLCHQNTPDGCCTYTKSLPFLVPPLQTECNF